MNKPHLSHKTLPWKRVWITGAGKGIGAALVEAFCHFDLKIIVSARTEADLLALQQQLAHLPAKIEVQVLDICDSEQVGKLIQSWSREQCLPDLAILNAGTHMPMGVKNFDLEKARQLLDVNLQGSLNCIAPLLNCCLHEAEAVPCHIGLVASVAGYRGLPTASVYGASKAALIHLAEALYCELDGSSVRIQVINPGFVRTPLTDKNEFAMPALMEPEDAAQAIIKGLQTEHFEIAFPARFVYWLKLLRLLPYRMYFALIKKYVPTKS